MTLPSLVSHPQNDINRPPEKVQHQGPPKFSKWPSHLTGERNLTKFLDCGPCILVVHVVDMNVIELECQHG